jgi:hypothetical protein
MEGLMGSASQMSCLRSVSRKQSAPMIQMAPPRGPRSNQSYDKRTQVRASPWRQHSQQKGSFESGPGNAMLVTMIGRLRTVRVLPLQGWAALEAANRMTGMVSRVLTPAGGVVGMPTVNRDQDGDAVVKGAFHFLHPRGHARGLKKSRWMEGACLLECGQVKFSPVPLLETAKSGIATVGIQYQVLPDVPVPYGSRSREMAPCHRWRAWRGRSFPHITSRPRLPHEQEGRCFPSRLQVTEGAHCRPGRNSPTSAALGGG